MIAMQEDGKTKTLTIRWPRESEAKYALPRVCKLVTTVIAETTKMLPIAPKTLTKAYRSNNNRPFESPGLGLLPSSLIPSERMSLEATNSTHPFPFHSLTHSLTLSLSLSLSSSSSFSTSLRLTQQVLLRICHEID